MRTRFYIDGFNLYYGCLKGSTNKWLNIETLFRNLVPRNEIDKIRYFTAKVSSRPNDPNQAVRQQTYLRALGILPSVETHFGHFLSHKVKMPDATAWMNGKYIPREVMKTEEKGSDVNLATWLLMDAFDNLFDCAVIISNDSDLKEPIKLVRERFGKTIGLLNPQKNVSQALRPLAHFIKPIRSGALANAQFPDNLEDIVGKFNKPAGW